MKSLIQKHVIGIPISSAAYTFERAPKRLLSDPSDQYYYIPPYASNESSKKSRVDSVISRMNKIGERMDNFAQGIREHVRLGPKLTETVKGKLSLGARILQVGGLDKVFKQNFTVKEDEKLLKAFQCYLSTTAGPIAGLLFISTDKVAFCSERSIKILSPTGKFLRVRYKVLIPLRKIKRANGSENMRKPSEKYIEVITEDNFEFWFMGFLNHQKTLRYLQQAISEAQEVITWAKH